MRLRRTLAALLVLLSVAATAHVAQAFLQPVSSPERVSAQVRWLNEQRAGDAPERMQRLFPEGAFFTHLLTGLAAASTGDADTVASALADSGAEAIRREFGEIPALDGGTFYRGWRLLLLAERVRLTGDGREALLAEAQTVQRALLSSPTGVPPSYPDGYWPCDAVVAMAAVVRAHRVAGVPMEEQRLSHWRTTIGIARDPGTGLLAHRIGPAGEVREGPRGSSQAIIQAFWPDVDAEGAGAQWQRFATTFVVREAGLVGVREYPAGDGTAGDVDSGPLLFGVSASASAVTLAAARRNGAVELAADLDHQAEYLGIPLEWAGRRRFAFGLLPVGDAFVAWARGVPVGDAGPGIKTPRPLWWAHAAVLLLPGLLAGTWLAASRRRSGRNTRQQVSGGGIGS